MCKYCEMKKEKQGLESGEQINDFAITRDGATFELECEIHDSYYVTYKVVEINYCPMCGRKLKEDN